MIRRSLLASMILWVAAPAAADPGDNHIGINTHVPDESTLDAVADLGMDWIRVDGNWFQLQPARDRYDWAFMDRVVDQASARGLNVYMTLAYTPAWVARVPERHPDGNAGNDQPASSAEWVAFVTEAVRHFRARGVTHFGIWNEANLEHFWDGDADGWVDTILVPGADAVRRECGDCVVLGPELAHVGDYDVFLDRVLERAMSSFDILAHHLYNGWSELGTEVWDGDRYLEALEMRRFSFTRASLREVLDRHGWTGEVWITETGYRADPVGDASEEADQARYAELVMDAQLARDWWTNTFFYEAVDCRPFLPSCDIDGYGILRANHTGARTFPGDYRRKPAFDAIRTYIDTHDTLPADAPTTTPDVDAGAPMPGVDAGPPPATGTDAGAPPATPGTDAGAPAIGPDGGAPPPPPSSDAGSGGAATTSGGCVAAPGRSGAPLAWLLLALGLLLRRARSER